MMKKYVKLIAGAYILCGLLAFSACEKEGPAGPAGQQGEQGVAGAKGDKGDKGDRGATGTANVIYSDWIYLKAPNWTTVGGYTFYKRSVPKLTKAILDKGQVLVYKRSGSTSDYSIMQLPITSSPSANSYYFSAIPQEITLTIFQTNGGVPSTPTVSYFRYVLIPGGVSATARAEGIDLGNFAEVAKRFNIPE